MAERRPAQKTNDALIKELHDIEVTPFTNGELHTHLLQRARHAKAEADTNRFALTLLLRSQEIDELESLHKQKTEEYNKFLQELDTKRDSAMADHNTKLQKHYRDSIEKNNAMIEKAIATAQSEVDKVIARSKTVTDQMEAETRKAENAVDEATTKKNKLEVEAAQIEQRINNYEKIHSNVVKDHQSQVDVLKREATDLRKMISDMKKERDSFLSRFAKT
jgi:chromosome segregation ATPase